MQTLAESTTRIIDVAYTDGPDEVRLAIVEAEAYLASFAAARPPVARAELVELLFERGPRTAAMDQVILAINSTPKRWL
jgi:hypothetical protein